MPDFDGKALDVSIQKVDTRHQRSVGKASKLPHLMAHKQVKSKPLGGTVGRKQQQANVVSGGSNMISEDSLLMDPYQQ